MTDDVLSDALRRAAEDYADLVEVETLIGAALARRDWRRRRGHKVCPVCSEALPVAAFGRDGSRRDGLEPRCKECRRVNAESATP